MQGSETTKDRIDVATAEGEGKGHEKHISDSDGHGGNASYAKFSAMMLISFIVMYGVMYLNTYAFDHVFFSMTRFYMTFLMIALMALIMLAFMRGMYPNKKINLSIVAASVVIFTLALIFVRSQTFIGDSAWMRAMIPHHSIAILTSERADIKDPEVRKLADEIIKTQEKEIAEMKRLLEKVK